MVSGSVDTGTHIVCEADARSEAERLLADPRLHVSERHRAFLSYIIDAFFDGRAETVKAYSIAVDVFNRPTTFDPSSDPIVRIEAARLRESLQKYYEEIRNEPGTRLEIPRGRYIPVFIQRDSPPCPQESKEVIADPVPPGLPRKPSLGPFARKWRHSVAGAAVLAGVVGSAILLYHALGSQPVDSRKPWVVLSVTAVGEDEATSRVLANDLAVSLARFGTIRLMSGAAAARYGAEQNTYSVSMRFSRHPDKVSIWWQVVDDGTGEAVWTDEETRPIASGYGESVLSDLVFGMARSLAGPAGVINAMELRRDVPATAIGNICVLRAEFAIEVRDPLGLETARRCLEATLAIAPADTDAVSTLARVLLWTGRNTGEDKYFGLGVALANRAATISPASPRAVLAQMATQYQSGQSEAAIAAGRRGVSANPENADLLAKLGMIVFLSGNWPEGRALAERAIQIAGRPIRDASFIMILDAYHQENYLQAVSLARQVPSSDTPTAVLKIAAVARMGDRTATDREIAVARLQHPDFDRTVEAMFSGNRYDRDLQTALRLGIHEAGLPAPALTDGGALLGAVQR